MRRLALIIFALGSLAAKPVPDVYFVRVWPQFHDAEYFKRISEYFSGIENLSHQVVVRSQPSRTGYYFLVRVKHPRVPFPGARFVLRIITPTNPVPKVYTFTVDCPEGEHVFNLGLTGSDWLAKSVHPVAWKLELLSKDGRPLASQQSFLWAQPD